MRGLSKLSWYLQRLPWALDKTYLGSRLQAVAEGRSDVFRGCGGYTINTMSGQEQEVGPHDPARNGNALQPNKMTGCSILAISIIALSIAYTPLRRCCMK